MDGKSKQQVLLFLKQIVKNMVENCNLSLPGPVGWSLFCDVRWKRSHDDPNGKESSSVGGSNSKSSIQIELLDVFQLGLRSGCLVGGAVDTWLGSRLKS